MTNSRNRILGALIFLPGVVFAIANATADANNAEPTVDAIAAVAISGAVGGAVALKPNRRTYWFALVWSAFSVGFEIFEARKHANAGAQGRMVASLGLAVVRAAGVALSARPAIKG